VFRKLTARQSVFDIVVGVAWAVLCGLLVPPGGYLDVAVGVLMGAAVAGRRWSPGLALVVAWVGAIVQMVGGQPPHIVDLAVLPVLYSTACYGGPVVRRLGLLSALVGAAVVTVYTMVLPLILPLLPTQFGVPIPETELLGIPVPAYVVSIALVFVASAVLFTLSWTLGLLARAWRIAREARIAAQVAERSVIVEQERNQLARDMHDVVAHSLAVVIAQADGARYTKDPIASADALATISATAREALTDVRLLLGRLRHTQEAGPQPRLADLDRLIDQVRDAGLTVSVDELGQRPTLHASESLAIYRILQEALTNALRHGDTAKPVEIRLDWATDAVELEVSNALREPQLRDPGHGLTGMQERATLVGGQFSAGIEREQFIVRATLPISPTAGAPTESSTEDGVAS
jgi:signal transduction histidine kinase